MGKRRKLIDTLFQLRLFDAFGAHSQFTVLTYHRVGDGAEASSFDHSVYGPVSEEFDRQMKWLSRHTETISERDLLGAIKGRIKLPNRSVLVTFDDGYKDQLTVAAPILRAHRIPALFFITPSMIDQRSVGFWDHIARAVRLTTSTHLRIEGQEFDLTRKDALLDIMRWVKERPGHSTWELTRRIVSSLSVAPATMNEQDPELMTWDDIANLAHDSQRHDFSIGSHGMTHRLLGRLNREEQIQELRESKVRLENVLGIPIHSLAYPAGSFAHETPTLALEQGYQAVFSFETGFNNRNSLNPADIKRVPAGNTTSMVACATSMPSVLGVSFYL